MKKRENYLFVEENNDTYTISMTPELQDDIGTVGFVEFMDVTDLNNGDVVLNLEASKTVFELATPLAGKIVERHEALLEQPELLNSHKPEENWVVKLTGVDKKAFAQLENA